MKILLAGGTGQLGSDCRKVLKDRFQLFFPVSKDLDITDGAAVDRIMKEVVPDTVLNCAAFTRVDDCETEREAAWKVNVEGPTNLAKACRRCNAKLIHISTDYVFDGLKRIPEPYVETDKTNPLSYYGLTKLEGEKAIRKITENHAILRTAWVYGIAGKNFLKTMLKLALKDPRKEIKVVNDQFGSPTWSFRLAQQLEKVMIEDGRGTYHATAEGYCTWYGLAAAFLNRMKIPHSFIPCTTGEYPTPARRPTNSILENARLKASGLHVMKTWEEDLDQFVLLYGADLLSEGLSVMDRKNSHS